MPSASCIVSSLLPFPGTKLYAALKLAVIPIVTGHIIDKMTPLYTQIILFLTKIAVHLILTLIII